MMSPLKTLIVDDEPLARQELRNLLGAHRGLEICGEAGTAREAIGLVEKHAPDVLFLDIALPGMNGFELLEKLPPPHPRVIFTTAFDAFAVKAFDVNALDYLLKPIDPARLKTAVEKLSAQTDPIQPVETSLTESDRVFVREGERCWFVPVNSIYLLEAEGNHTRVHFNHEKPLLYRTLTSLEERLPAKTFLRANRSQIFNLTSVASLGQWFSGSLKVTLHNGVEVELSRRQAQIFRSKTGL